MKANQNIVSDIKQFINLKCWACIVSRETGTVISLKLGNKIPRKSPLPNNHIPDDVKLFESDFGIIIWSSWQLFHKGSLIINTQSSEINIDEISKDIKNIENKKLINIYIERRRNNLILEFQNGWMLKSMCDGKDMKDDNYTLYYPHCNLTLTEDLRWIVEVNTVVDVGEHQVPADDNN
jgi:hypothetical protein